LSTTTINTGRPSLYASLRVHTKALFKPVLRGEGYEVRPLQGDDDFDKFLQKWAAMAVATSKLFSCKMVEEIRVHAAFVDMAV